MGEMETFNSLEIFSVQKQGINIAFHLEDPGLQRRRPFKALKSTIPSRAFNLNKFSIPNSIISFWSIPEEGGSSVYKIL